MRLLFLLLAFVAASAFAADPLPRLKVAPDAATVAGVSSGGAMAVQLHVAYSAIFSRGAAVFAGTPYECARGSIGRANTRCMKAIPTPPEVDVSIRITEERARAGTIDPLAGFAKSRVYLFSGKKDPVVRPPVMDAVNAYYRHYLDPSNIVYNNQTAATHAWISPIAPQQGDGKGKLFLNNCGIDPPQEFLTLFYGSLKPRSAQETLRGRLVEFDQKEVFEDRKPAEHSVAETGWAFIPTTCAAGEACKVLVALHGCLQNYGSVRDAFIRRSGLNEWADTNDIVVLYPQTIAKVRGNPNACWDWWGYTTDDYAMKSGVQMRAIKAMVDRVTGKDKSA